MRLLFALLLCLVPATMFAAPVQLSLSGTVISKQSALTFVDVGDPFFASLTYDIPTGATSTFVSGFLYYKSFTWTFRELVVMSNGFPAEEILTEFNGLAPVDTTICCPPLVFAPHRFSMLLSPTSFSSNVAFLHLGGGPSAFRATGTVTPVPEPTTIGLLATGLAIGVARRLRKSRAGR
jgi:hypothetical protein